MKLLLLLVALVMSMSTESAELVLDPKTGPCVTTTSCRNGDCVTYRVGIVIDTNLTEEQIVVGLDSMFIVKMAEYNINAKDVEYLIKRSLK